LKNCESKLERRNQPNEVEEIERLKQVIARRKIELREE
jgi:hypothetical protein